MVAQIGYSVAGRSGSRVTLCAVYTVHKETRSVSFLVEPQNQGRRFISGLDSKSLGRFVLKITVTVCQWFGLKTTKTVPPCLTSKPVVTVYLSLVFKLMVEGFPV
jgi:hypothetical protein